MLKIDIIEAVQNMLEEKIQKEWKHEVFIDAIHNNAIICNIDGKNYTISLYCAEEGE